MWSRENIYILWKWVILQCFMLLLLRKWVDAFVTTVFFINRMPTPVWNNSSHFQNLFPKTPNMSLLKFFKCLCCLFVKTKSLIRFSQNRIHACFSVIVHRIKDPIVYTLQQEKFIYLDMLCLMNRLFHLTIDQMFLNLSSKLNKS